MAMKEIKARSPKTSTEATVNYDFGDNAEQAIAKFGAEVVFTNFCGAATITAQGAIRRYLEKGLSAEEIAAKMADWKPGVALAREGADPLAAAMAKFATLTPEQQKEYLGKLREKANA